MSFKVTPNQTQPSEIKPAAIRPKVDRRFSSFLSESIEKPLGQKEVKISNHAQKRLEERGLQLDQQDMHQLEAAVEELSGKGSKNSLIFYKDMALITSVPNRTIITALNTQEMDMVTNIDSAMRINQ
ncbi:TIGR02530 family flagellar biosynthesis protein [Carnobacterium antarcticum]|uniref:TIGR02530 family flagellar biosynthesis protein n=1 Tax=Carnobacterium antarcticum TaxID=2126436 RepID=A0ABW4NKF6_9LACT|nr:TIGR02530 family flagellar biosynthesis protein [Carnobacterium sp. CP1]ALV22038.1 flagellar hook associated protein [Carnobacterium sp. CP1]